MSKLWNNAKERKELFDQAFATGGMQAVIDLALKAKSEGLVVPLEYESSRVVREARERRL
jgi:hypothetical protein